MLALEAISSAGFPANYKPLLEGLAILIVIVVGVEYWTRRSAQHGHHHPGDHDKDHH